MDWFYIDSAHDELLLKELLFEGSFHVWTAEKLSQIENKVSVVETSLGAILWLICWVGFDVLIELMLEISLESSWIISTALYTTSENIAESILSIFS